MSVPPSVEVHSVDALADVLNEAAERVQGCVFADFASAYVTVHWWRERRSGFVCDCEGVTLP